MSRCAGSALPLAMLLLILAMPLRPVFAQGNPSFDCAKATTAIERAICGDREAAAADRAMADAYRRLSQSLTDAQARAHLQRDQAAWLTDRQRLCTAAPGEQRDAGDFAMCLREQAALRGERLALLPGGDGYPYVGERRLLEQGRRGGVPYRIAVSYAVFEKPGSDLARVNAAIKAWVDDIAGHARPPAQASPGDPDIGWFLESGHVVHVAAPTLVTVAAHWLLYSGGAHPNNGRRAWHVDTAAGRLLGLDDIFDRNAGWVESVLRLVRDDLKAQFTQRPGFDESLEPPELRKMLVQPGRWIFGRDKVVVGFDPYEVGPYAAGPYEVELSYSELAPHIRRDGPLGARRR